MTLLDRWDVGLVPFPFTDGKTSKKRPALALSLQSFNGATGVTILSMVTKAELSAWYGDYSIVDWPSAGLLLPSIVRLKIFTLENALVLKRLGRLETRDVEGFLKLMRKVLP